MIEEITEKDDRLRKTTKLEFSLYYFESIPLTAEKDIEYDTPKNLHIPSPSYIKH